MHNYHCHENGVDYIFHFLLSNTALFFEVRAVAVNALFKFGEGVESVRDDVITLLERCLMDEDDIVRDRAVQAISTLRSQVQPQKEKKLNMLDLEYTLTKYLGKKHAFHFSLISFRHFF